jgi:hypothetical protein
MIYMAIKFGEGYHFSNEPEEVSGEAREHAGKAVFADQAVDAPVPEYQLEGLESRVDEPIMTCVGTRSDFGDTLPENFKQMLDEEKRRGRFEYVISEGIDNVSYFASTKDKEQAGLISSGALFDVMSPVDSNDKFSSGFTSCIGLVVVGKSKETGENISTMLHTPLFDPNDKTEGTILGKFVSSLDLQLEKIKSDSVEGSVNSVIAGGRIQKSYGDLDLKNYSMTKDFISSRVERYFENPPKIVGGGAKVLKDEVGKSETVPRDTPGSQSDEIYFDNKNRRLFLLRPEYTKDK